MSPRVDLIEHRYLGALLFLDEVTGTPILDALDVAGLDPGDPRVVPTEPPIRFLRNRRNRYAIVAADDLEDHLLADDPAQDPDGIRGPRPANTATVRIPCRVIDTRRRFVPMRFHVELPRDPDPATPNFVASLFRPQAVSLFPAPNAPIAPNWAVLRVRVTDAADTRRGLPFALLHLTHESTGQLLGVGLTDHRGEGLLAVADLPAQEWGVTLNAPVESNEIPCLLEAAYDSTLNPGALDQDALELERDPAAGLILPDPVDLQINRPDLDRVSTAPGELSLSPGRVDRRDLTIVLT